MDIEKASKSIVELRTQRKRLQDKINILVDKVSKYMKDNNKRILKAGSYSIELAPRLRREFDFDALDRLQKKGIITHDMMKTHTYERLLITSSHTIGLADGKWIKK